MAAKKCKEKLIKAKQANYFSLMRQTGRYKIQKMLLKKYDEDDSVQDNEMFLKRVILWYGMVCYAMQCYPMVWYGMESMVCYEISMLCNEMSILCYDWFMM